MEFSNMPHNGIVIFWHIKASDINMPESDILDYLVFHSKYVFSCQYLDHHKHMVIQNVPLCKTIIA